MNRANSLHGGLISTLIDSVGSLAVASNGWYNTGISTDIHATFVKPGGGDGDTVRVTGEIISMGTCGSSNPDPRQDAFGMQRAQMASSLRRTRATALCQSVLSTKGASRCSLSRHRQARV